MSKKSLALLLSMCFITFFVNGQETKFTFLKEKNGIKVFQRKSLTDGVNELLIQTTFNSKLSTIVEVFNDIEAYPQWVYKSNKSFLVKTIKPNEVEYYNNLDFPFPLHDRDIIIHNKIDQNKSNKILTSVSYATKGDISSLSNTVRIVDFNSKWTFTPLKDHIFGEYIIKSSPGGSIPIWLINLAIDEGPIQTILNLKKRLQIQKYKDLNTMNIDN